MSDDYGTRLANSVRDILARCDVIDDPRLIATDPERVRSLAREAKELGRDLAQSIEEENARLRADLDSAVRERDEARKERDHAGRERDMADALNGRIIRERDAARARAEELRDALAGMVEQFAYYKRGGFLTDGGLSALEDAFAALGYEHPHPAPHRKCDEPGCEDEGECGTPEAGGGYRRVCHKHFVEINKRNDAHLRGRP